MLRQILAAGALAGLAATASAQCSSLAATNNAGAVTLDMTGAGAMSFSFFLVGDTTGTTPISIGNLGSVTLGLAAPFVPVPAGWTDMNGDVSLTFDLPATLPAGDYYAQGLSIGFNITPGTGVTFDLCESNVETITVN